MKAKNEALLVFLCAFGEAVSAGYLISEEFSIFWFVCLILSTCLGLFSLYNWIEKEKELSKIDELSVKKGRQKETK